MLYLYIAQTSYEQLTNLLLKCQMTDVISTLRPHNIIPMTAAGLQNMDLTLYLLKELAATKEQKMSALREFIPDANASDWTLVDAGQRVSSLSLANDVVYIIKSVC